MATDDSRGTDVVLADLELTRSLSIQLMAIGTMGLGVAWAIFAGLFQTVLGVPATFAFAPAGAGWWTDSLDLLVVLLLATAVLVPHELLHGAAIRYYGGRARYGVGVAHFVLPYAYATTDHEFTRNQFVVVLLTPLVVISVVGSALMLAFGWGWLVAPLAANAAGAIVDLWMTVTLLGFPAHVRLEDHPKGVRIVGREGDRPLGVSATAAVWEALSGAAMATVAVLVCLAVIGPFVLSALGVTSITVGTPGTITHLLSFTETATEISLVVGPGVLVLGAVVGLAYSLVRSYRRGGGEASEFVADGAGE